MTNPITLTRTQASQLLKISPCTFDNMRRNGQMTVPPINWNGRPRWSRAAIAQWLGGHPDMTDDDFALLTTVQVAQLLGIARATAYRQLPDTTLYPAVIRLGTEIRYPRTAVNHYINNQRAAAA